MRFLTIVSVFFAVTQLAFAAPVFGAFHSNVITCNLPPAQLQERGFNVMSGLEKIHKKVKNGLAPPASEATPPHASEAAPPLTPVSDIHFQEGLPPPKRPSYYPGSPGEVRTHFFEEMNAFRPHNP
ncbi:hypothetical protein K439DRAFT_1622897 [Ramaria rubella]|nr:hypothetical protein K439DRAFT_1622897 [Ramaria rubella]